MPGTKHISYHKKDKRYSVTVTINGKNRHLGSSPSLISALMMRDWCQANNWEVYPFNRNNSCGEKYIHYRNNLNVYEIIKNINGQNEYFGRYHTLKEAIKWRDYFQSRGWPVNERLVGSINKNIKFRRGKYIIYKRMNGREHYFGSFNSLEDAEEELFLLRKFNWDYDLLCENANEITDDEGKWLTGVRKMRTSFEKQKYRNDIFLKLNS